MQFDLFTFLASLFNFIVLLVLLRIFLFKRITRAMDTREQNIADRWDEAEEKRANAAEKEERYESKLRDIQEEKRRIIEEAREEAEEAKREEMESAREEVKRQRQSWIEALEGDKQALADAIERDMAEKTAGAVRSTLSEFAGAELLNMMVNRFAERIGEASDDISSSFHGEALTVVSSDDLSDDQKQSITSALERFNHQGVEFKTDPSLICGIDLKGGGSKLSWSISGQMEQLDQLIEKRMARVSAA